MKHKSWKRIYLIIFWGSCILPLAGMTVQKENVSSENRTLAQFPSIKTVEGWNYDWLSQAGEYFQDHFAFRSKMVTANALLQGKILGTSTASGVIQGTDGWLFYADSLDDYLGVNLLSDRSLFNIAHTLAMIQQKLTAKEIAFTFALAPNKNTLYGSHMPYYDRICVSDEKNMFRLKEFLNDEGVSYTDLYERLSAEEGVVYHKRDSHWNNQGAAIAADTILSTLGKKQESYADQSFSMRKDFEGDLDKMLYPDALTPEEEIYYDREWTFHYVTDTESNFDPKIETVTEGQQGKLVMFRDSFTNALLPFMAESYGNAYFSRGVPYQMREVEARSADAVVIERAERFLPDMAKNPPVLECPAFRISGEAEIWSSEGADHLSMEKQGALTKVSGHIQKDFLNTATRIFANLNGGEYLYEAYPMDIQLEEDTSDGGFCLYLGQEAFLEGENHIIIYVLTEDNLKQVSQNIIQEEKKE